MIDQFKQAATLQIATHGGSNDAGSSGVTREIDDGDRNAVSAGPGDLDRQLCLSQTGTKQCQGEENAAGNSGHCVHFQKFRAILLFKRAVFDFKGALKE